MALAIDIIHGRGHRNKMDHQLQPKKTKVRLYQLLIMQQKVSFVVYITNNSIGRYIKNTGHQGIEINTASVLQIPNYHDKN